MKSQNKRKKSLPSIIFFTLSGIVLVISVVYLVRGSTNPDFYWHSPSTSSTHTRIRSTLNGNTFLLLKDQIVAINNARFAYKGTINGDLIFDHYIPQLDPHYAYNRQIPSKSAKKGFRLGKTYFRLLAANKNKISMQLLDGH